MSFHLNKGELFGGVSHLIPATYCIQVLRGIILRGSRFADLWVNALVLTLMGAGGDPAGGTAVYEAGGRVSLFSAQRSEHRLFGWKCYTRECSGFC